MNRTPRFEIFVVCIPGLETDLQAEVLEKGFAGATVVPGGVVFEGDWSDVWRANLELRGASRILARIGSFLAFHLAQLDKRARKFPWGEFLRADVPVRVQATCKASKIYHAGAATQRIENALRDSIGITISPEAEIVLKARIDDNVVTLSLDTSGEPLHRRGHKEAVGKAPIRETLAALLLCKAGYSGNEPVVDPMCGSGTFPIEAAEIAAGLYPGRGRSFAFEHFAQFDNHVWDAMRVPPSIKTPKAHFYGSDRDAGAIRMSKANAERAGVSDLISFENHPVSELQRPDGPPGLIMINPPYGARIGNKKLLYGLHGALGQTLKERFKGWRVGLVTSEQGLAKATGLSWRQKSPPIAHGGLKVWFYQTDRLG